jgi:PTS system fructose-specific IIC component
MTGRSITHWLAPRHVQLELAAKNREEALRGIVHQLAPLAGNPAAREKFLAAMLEREKLHTTAVGDGVAFPHTRGPVGELMPQGIVFFARHKKGLEFQALDKKPVTLLFAIAAPIMTEHLQILSLLSRLLRHALLRQELMEATTAEAVLGRLAAAEARLKSGGH